MIKLYLDEDAPEAIAKALRLRGYDVVTVREVARRGLTDIEQLNHASSEDRVIFSFNVADFNKSILNLLLMGVIIAVLSFPSNFQ